MLKNMNMSEYLAAEGISKSGLDQLSKSPAHYQAWLKEKPEPTAAMIFGSAVHCALLEPHRFPGSYVQAPEIERRSNAGKAAYADWERANAGKMVLSQDQMETIRGMQDAFNSHPLVSGVLRWAQIERCAFWRDEETNVLCKSRPDIVTSNGLVIDLKTTADASKEAFARDSWKYRYHVQAAMYLEGVTSVLGKLHSDFLFIAVEKEAPYAISVYAAEPVFLTIGRDQMRAGLQRYAECNSRNEWHGYPEEVQKLSLPTWALGG